MLASMIILGRIRAYMKEQQKLEHLQFTFPKLTEVNQQYMLGVALGLTHAQSKREKEKQNVMKSGTRKMGN